MYSIINKGIPMDIPYRVSLDAEIIILSAIEKEDINTYLKKWAIDIMKYVYSIPKHKSSRYLFFDLGMSIEYLEDEKRNVIVAESYDILSGIFEYLNISTLCDIQNAYQKCKKLRTIINEKKLKKFFPKLYDCYLSELEKYKKTMLYILDNGKTKDKSKFYMLENGKKIYKKALLEREKDEEKVDYEIEDTLNINKISYFCNTYAGIIEDILDHFEIIKKYCTEHYVDLDRYHFNKEMLEADIVNRYIQIISSLKDNNQKQRYMYYLMAYFKENKNKLNGKIFKLKEEEITFEELYNKYIDILIENPSLRIFDYDYEYFKDYTSKEIEEYMELELKGALSNWDFMDENSEDRIAKAIYNSTKNIKENSKRTKSIEELKNLFMRKKELFDNSNFYKVVYGQNTFDGYVAYIYSNGKVILERFFKRRKDKSEVVALQQAIYVMNIEDFYSISKLSKRKIIKDNLCKRYIHNGNWEEKIKKEINSIGKSSTEEYKKLVLEKKIID